GRAEQERTPDAEREVAPGSEHERGDPDEQWPHRQLGGAPAREEQPRDRDERRAGEQHEGNGPEPPLEERVSLAAPEASGQAARRRKREVRERPEQRTGERTDRHLGAEQAQAQLDPVARVREPEPRGAEVAERNEQSG